MRVRVNGKISAMLYRVLALLGAVLASALVSSGCANHDIIDPVVDIPEQRSVVVVPFQDNDFRNGFDSPRGCELATRVTKILKEKAEFRVKPIDCVLALYNDQNPTALSAPEVAQKTGADYVLMGHVLKWQLRDPNTIGLYRGSSVIELTLWESAESAKDRLKDDKVISDLPHSGPGYKAFVKQRVQALFPREYGMSDIGVSDMGMTEEQVDEGLVNSSAQQCAWVLLAHTKDEDKLSQGK